MRDELRGPGNFWFFRSWMMAHKEQKLIQFMKYYNRTDIITISTWFWDQLLHLATMALWITRTHVSWFNVPMTVPYRKNRKVSFICWFKGPEMCLVNQMLTVNDASGTHNTKVTTTENDLIHTWNTEYGRIYFDTSHANQANTTEKRRNPYFR
jgi:hypothetical protein